MEENLPRPDDQEKTRRIRLAVTSLITGTISIGYSIFLIGAVFALIGISTGFMHRRKSKELRGMALAGIFCSVIGLAASTGFGLVYSNLYRMYQDRMKTSDPGSDLSSWENVAAPDFEVETIDGKIFKLSDCRGKRVVIDFWATWCRPCMKEIPHFNELAMQTSRDSLIIIGISREAPEKLREAMGKTPINYEIASADKLPVPYKKVRSIPTTFFIDRNGIIQKVFSGYHDYDAIQSEALSPDFEGTPKPEPEGRAKPLEFADLSYRAEEVWRQRMEDISLLASVDLNSEGLTDILAVESGRKMHVLNQNGEIIDAVELPSRVHWIEAGRGTGGQVLLLLYQNWGKSIHIIDTKGNSLLEHVTENGVNGAHWIDLDQDGTDEVIIGFNGLGGLQAISQSGSLIWKNDERRNIWNQSALSIARPFEVLIFTTDATGSIRRYNSEGRSVDQFRPLGGYYSTMHAADLDGAGSIQVLAEDHGTIVAADRTGRIQWSSPCADDHATWRRPSYASGDLDGDGVKDWVFLETETELVVASRDGKKLAFVSVPDCRCFTVCHQPGRKGLLIACSGDLIIGYRLVASDGSALSFAED